MIGSITISNDPWQQAVSLSVAGTCVPSRCLIERRFNIWLFCRPLQSWDLLSRGKLMRLRSVILTLAGILAGSMGVAQQSSNAPQGTLAEIHINKVKPGMTRKYEEGRKKHMMWHHKQKDAWSWYTWEIVTGENTGAYVIGTFGHNWSDLDGRAKFEAEDSVDAIAHMGATLESETQS